MRTPLILACLLLSLAGLVRGETILLPPEPIKPGECYHIMGDMTMQRIPCGNIVLGRAEPEPQITWLGWAVVGEPLGANEGTILNRYELGLRDDGVVVWRKVRQE